jgi:hypothetical protein
MKSTLLFSIVALLLLPGAQVREPGPGKRSMAEEGQADYFRKMKPRFKYVNLKRFSNENFGHDNKLKLTRMDTLTYRKLFRKSRIFFPNNEGRTASYYAYNERPGYYQLVFAGNGRYVSDLVLFHFAPDGKLLAEQTVSCFFVDAGLAEVTKSYLRGDSLLIRAELNLGEAPAGTPCDSLVTVFKIARNGAMNQVSKKMFKIKCR